MMDTLAARTERRENAEPAADAPHDLAEGAALLDDMVAAIKQHLVLPPYAAETMALWVMFAHTFEAWKYSPRLALTSPEWGCGKTTALEVLTALCPGGKIIANASEAYVFHTTDSSKGGPLTLLFDECDTFLKEKPTLRGVLNAGFQVGSFVGRCEKDSAGNFVTRDYAIEAPIALAGIGDSWLWDETRSRSVVVPMKKPRQDERYEKYRPQRHGATMKALATRAASWATQNAAALREAEPQMPPKLRGRIADKWEPLIAIADAAGGHWPRTARRVALAMSGEREPMPQGAQLLAGVRSVFEERGVDRLSSEQLCEGLNKSNDETRVGPLDPSQLAAALMPYGIEPKRIKFDGTQLRGYMREQFEDAWARFLPPVGDGVTPSGGSGEGVGVTAGTGA